MVIGLGTGEVVALHHSGVPRKNEQGQWMKKDGTIADDNDPDSVIDWLGNEGIRVNSILDAIKGLPLPPPMEDLRKEILSYHILMPESPLFEPEITMKSDPIPKTNTNMKEEKFRVFEETASPPAVNALPTGRTQYFELVISSNPVIQESWNNIRKTFMPGIVDVYALFPLSTDAYLKNIYLLTINSNMDPWQLAALIEATPEVEQCIPDTETPYDRKSNESFLQGSESDEQNWENFTKEWKEAEWVKDDIAANLKKNYRKWAHTAVNAEKGLKQLSPEARQNLAMMKLFQLDTGYSDITKNAGGYDFENDYDTIDDDADARDIESGRLGRFPDHGTRTASIIIGTALKQDSSLQCDGNLGILSDGKTPLIKLIPYRISNSVILIGRGHSLVNAANKAMANGADVMYTCMGSYPRPMFDAVARSAYEKGVIWICAAGNQVKTVIAPALYPGTIAVAAVNPAFRVWTGSSRGPEVDISAPGEKVYVPFYTDDRSETMRFGNGTSYATPHVAAAAFLWKAKHLPGLASTYPEAWMIVEAFRYCLQVSVKPFPDNWNDYEKTNWGAGFLDIYKLLTTDLPAATDLTNVYSNRPTPPKWDLGITESVAKIWDAIAQQFSDEEEFVVPTLTSRGRAGLNAMIGKKRTSNLELSVTSLTDSEQQQVLQTYFSSFSNPQRYEKSNKKKRQ